MMTDAADTDADADAVDADADADAGYLSGSPRCFCSIKVDIIVIPQATGPFSQDTQGTLD